MEGDLGQWEQLNCLKCEGRGHIGVGTVPYFDYMDSRTIIAHDGQYVCGACVYGESEGEPYTVYAINYALGELRNAGGICRVFGIENASKWWVKGGNQRVMILEEAP